MKPEEAVSVRESISFPPDIHEIPEQLARQKKMLLVWIARDAADRQVAEQEES